MIMNLLSLKESKYGKFHFNFSSTYCITCAVTKKAKPRKITTIVFMILFLITSFAVDRSHKIAVVIVAILFIAFGMFINNNLSGDGNNEK